jgi:hypothetical protein
MSGTTLNDPPESDTSRRFGRARTRFQPGNQNPIRSRPDDSFGRFPAESGKETSATIAARPEKSDSFVEIQAVMKE